MKLQKTGAWKLTKKKSERLKGVYIRTKRLLKIWKEEDQGGNLFWKEVSKANERKLENCRLAVGKDEVRRIWKNYFKDLYK